VGDGAGLTRAACKMEYFAQGTPHTVLDAAAIEALLERMLAALGSLRRVLLVPPDMTRRASGAGELTAALYARLRDTVEVHVLPALGTHAPLTPAQLTELFPGVPRERIHEHNWRGDLARLGAVPADFVRDVSGGRVAWPIECAVNRRLVEGRWDRILSIGQLVPHEVAGIANHAKNLLVGLGGPDMIHKTHFLSAVCGLERLMGRVQTPVRAVLDYAATRLARDLPVSYVLIVRGRDAAGRLVTRGLFAGDDAACFRRGAELCRQVNITQVDRPLAKVVVFLDPAEYTSTWLGNKAIYRTRLALAADGELVILAPGVARFGEDALIDALIRRYGYRGTAHTLRLVGEHADLGANLAAAAHLIHGSSEGRFTVTYAPGGLERAAVEGVGYDYAEPAPLLKRYDPRHMHDGLNTLADGEEVYFISNPGLGLWAARGRLDDPPSAG